MVRFWMTCGVRTPSDNVGRELVSVDTMCDAVASKLLWRLRHRLGIDHRAGRQRAGGRALGVVEGEGHHLAADECSETGCPN